MMNATGVTVFRGEYDPHGNPLLVWSVIGNPYLNNNKFTGYERDYAAGLDFAQARHYKYGRGRFMQPDPLGGGDMDSRCGGASEVRNSREKAFNKCKQEVKDDYGDKEAYFDPVVASNISQYAYEAGISVDLLAITWAGDGDPSANLALGAQKLAYLTKRNNGSERDAASAYVG